MTIDRLPQSHKPPCNIQSQSIEHQSITTHPAITARVYHALGTRHGGFVYRVEGGTMLSLAIWMLHPSVFSWHMCCVILSADAPCMLSPPACVCLKHRWDMIQLVLWSKRKKPTNHLTQHCLLVCLCVAGLLASAQTVCVLLVWASAQTMSVSAHHVYPRFSVGLKGG